nr:immunoglobulin light chain junction region [Mus musculus]NSL99219.1 immunoglobulin light chain junction region [Mus musculus]NSM01149.1 immunoglobulin light chain junction region [Mus musculus]NSM01416.1 immunoglobulin light chain junction region [Mus musculus]
CHQRSSYPYTF